MTPQSGQGAGVESTPERETAASGRERAQQSAEGIGALSSGDIDQRGPDASSTSFQSKGDSSQEEAECSAALQIQDWRSEATGDDAASVAPEQAGGFPAPSGGGGRGVGVSGEARIRAERAPSAPLPCRSSNNCTKPEPRHYRMTEQTEGFGPYGEHWSSPEPMLVDSGRRRWSKEGDVLKCLDGITSAEAKAAFQLRRNVEAFVEHWGRERCGFLTLTDSDGLHPLEFARRWHSFLTHEGKWIVAFVRVLEAQKCGRPHYHLLTAVPWKMRPDEFDWRAFADAQEERHRLGRTARFRNLRQLYIESAAPELRAVWKDLREVLPKYGLGRSEFLPVRKGAGAICEYIGKYLEKGFEYRKRDWKGVRRIEYDRRNTKAWKRCSRVFAWYNPKAIEWRRRVALVASTLGLPEFEDLSHYLGRHWAYWLRAAILTGTDEEVRTTARLLAAERTQRRRFEHGSRLSKPHWDPEPLSAYELPENPTRYVSRFFSEAQSFRTHKAASAGIPLDRTPMDS